MSEISSQFKCDQATWGICRTKTILSLEGGACALSHNWLVTSEGFLRETNQEKLCCDVPL
jgi:hypothetical protein